MKGFSLLEIMVVIAVIAVMAGGVVVGFNSFGNTVKARETAGVLTDTIKRLELETIRRDYVKNTVHFESDYLAVESEAENQTLGLQWLGVGTAPCAAGEAKIHIKEETGAEAVYLARRDEYGNNLNIESFPSNADEDYCIDFNSAEDIEWQYQLFQGSQVSQLVRLIHFNIRRDDTSDPVQITGGTDYTLEIAAPYAKKTFYDTGDETTGTVELTLENSDDSQIITLQE